MKHTSSTLRILFILGVVTIAVALGHYFFFLDIRDTNRATSLLEGEVDVTIQKKIELHTLRDVVENTQSDRNKINNFFITGNDIVDFLEVIEGLGENTGADINLRSIGEGDGETKNFSEELTLHVSAAGKWKEVYHFFALLESLPYHITIQQVQFSRSNSLDDKLPSWLGIFVFSVTKI